VSAGEFLKFDLKLIFGFLQFADEVLAEGFS
jgi:hypothetical protein